MNETSIEYLNRFERRQQEELLQMCTQYKALDGTLLTCEDIDSHWKKIAPEYMADAVGLVQQYPTVSLAWAAYLGMAIAAGWDTDWAKCSETPYNTYYGEQGFDDMDEHIVQHILNIPLSDQRAKDIESLLRRLAQTAITLIRREQIEPQSPMAFHVFARSVKVMFKMGAAIELKRRGYKFEQVFTGN
ncbi:MAG: hypothetical protein II222_04560 [Paraprevotella sp.]|nr:hypothetical protein [Paraprevotella sp.]